MRLLALLPLIGLFAGCASDLGVSSAADVARAKFVTSDQQALRARWGAYADLADKAWLQNQYDGRRYTWVVPSVVLDQESFFWGTVSHQRIEYDPSTNTLRVRDPRDQRYIRSAAVRKDGSVVWESNWFFDWSETVINFDAETREAVWQTKENRRIYKEVPATAYGLADAEARRLNVQALAQLQADKAAADARSAAFWNSLLNGAAAAMQTAAQVSTSSRLQSGATAGATAVRASPPVSPKGSATTASPNMDSTGKAYAAQRVEQVSSKQAHATGRMNPSPTSQVALEARTQKVDARTDESAGSRSRLMPTPEAIVVCTRPDLEGRFTCDTPLETNKRGGPKALSQHSTPERMVGSSDACTTPRRLESATHLVWGCGFGATNNGDSMDRSAGVDVRGRTIYYCAAKESPCRRTAAP